MEGGVVAAVAFTRFPQPQDRARRPARAGTAADADDGSGIYLNFASLVTCCHEPSEVPTCIVVEDEDKDKPAEAAAPTAAESTTSEAA